MENIVKKAIKGGYVKERYYFDENGNWDDEPYEVVVCNPLFWQALGKACGWGEWEASSMGITCNVFGKPEVYIALKFYELNLTESWDKAVIWLEALITNQDK